MTNAATKRTPLPTAFADASAVDLPHKSLPPGGPRQQRDPVGGGGEGSMA
jgi:hypothetical protein